MPLNTSVDAILQRMITDARNLNPTINVSVGSDTYIRFSTAASAIYGLYKQSDWTLGQIFPQSMSPQSLEEFAAYKGWNVDDLTPAEMLYYILSMIRNPKSGGKPQDFERWAMETTSEDTSLALSSSMITGTFPQLQPANLLKKYDMDTAGFVAFGYNTGAHLKIDVGESKDIVGIGLGFSTSRTALFNILTSDDDITYTQLTTIPSNFWWSIKKFDQVTTRYIMIQLAQIEELTEEWQEEALNGVSVYGIEVYAPSETAEKATSAKCLHNYHGVGTVMIRLQPSNLSLKHCEAVREKCEYEGPVAPREIYVSVPSETTLDLRVSLTGTLSSVTLFNADIERYFASLDAGDLFIPAQIIVYALKYGAYNASIEISVNGGNFEPATDAMTSGSMEKFVIGEVTFV